MKKSEYNKIQEYCKTLSTDQPALLYQLERETYLKTLAPQMMSGHLQGRLLSLFSHLIQPRRILEIGTFTAYATLCMAEGLPPDGILHTIEANEELAPIIKKYIDQSKHQGQIRLHLGDANHIIPTLDEIFDIIFIDGGKMDYHKHFNLVIDKVRKGGLIIADNVLWSGKIIHEPRDKDTQTLHDFNQLLKADSRVEVLMLPLRDGLSIARRI